MKNKKECEKEEVEVDEKEGSFFEKQLVNNKHGLLDKMANFVDKLTKGEDDFESQLDNIDGYREELAEKEREAARKRAIEEENKRQKERQRQKKIAARDHLYEPFAAGSKEHPVYGFKKNGVVVINAEYDGVTKFSNASSKVCKIISDSEVAYNFIDHENNKLAGSWKKGTADSNTKAVCNGVDDSHDGKITTYEFIERYTKGYKGRDELKCFENFTYQEVISYKVVKYDTKGNRINHSNKKFENDLQGIGPLCMWSK